MDVSMNTLGKAITGTFVGVCFVGSLAMPLHMKGKTHSDLITMPYSIIDHGMHTHNSAYQYSGIRDSLIQVVASTHVSAASFGSLSSIG
jgi:flagellar motor component MotA